ncbi:MAG: glycosyltransferase [Chloroflexi bacterium]|nr:glycosyltransferase [Chloroflexota bacterium]
MDTGHSLPLTITVVIPTKNEARNIAWVLDHMDPIVDEVIIVDYHSTDGTTEVARMIRPDVVIVNHGRPGKGEAVRAGLQAAKSDFVVMIDADGSMDPSEIRRFVEALADGHDLAKGSRFMDGGGTEDMTLLRRTGNAALVALTNLLLGTSDTELCYGFMAFRRSRIHELGLRSTGFEIETEIVVRAHRAGLAVIEVPSFESPRRHGESNLHTFRDGWRVLRTLLRERAARMPLPNHAERADSEN